MGDDIEGDDTDGDEPGGDDAGGDGTGGDGTGGDYTDVDEPGGDDAGGEGICGTTQGLQGWLGCKEHIDCFLKAIFVIKNQSHTNIISFILFKNGIRFEDCKFFLLRN